MKRKLAAILSADIQGYSRLMGDDEEATIRTLTTYREVVTSCVRQHHGRVVDSPGDNLLAEFASAVDAVQGAVALQRDLKTRNAKLPARRQMHYRIGINVGDVVVEDERLYGDGVTIAARLESLADGGGITVSGTVYDQVSNKLDVFYTYQGEQTVKNIAQPVRVYTVELDTGTTAPVLSGEPATALPRQQTEPRHVVGRTTELRQLGQWLTAALGGERQLVCVTGEPGIGKTTLVNAFLDSQTLSKSLWIGHGQCIEQYGAGEAYLPILEAINRLCQTPDGQRLIAILRQHAPTWLVQLPSLVAEADREALQRQVQGFTQERMLREMAEALVLFTAQHGLVLVLEDLHWSDASTLELLAYLARRQEPARLCILGTYRPADAFASNHPLKGMLQELQARRQCQELPVTPLQEAAISDYVTHQLGGATSPPTLVDMIHWRTEGNPLFMVATIDYLTRQGLLVEEAGRWIFKGDNETLAGSVPDSVHQLIEKQIESLSEEDQQLLEVASVVGAEFSVAAVSVGLSTPFETIEAQCEGLTRRRQFIREHGFEEWPDGTLSGRYSFLHALYQNVLYVRLSEARRVRLHKHVGERKEAAYGAQAREIAAELAVHFAHGRAYAKAIQYRSYAGKNAVRRHANQEAITHFTTGLSFLHLLPDTHERAQRELSLQIALGIPLMVERGYASPDVERTYLRVRELSQQYGDPTQQFWGLYGLAIFHLARPELKTAHALSQQLLQLADTLQNPAFRVIAHHTQGLTMFYSGDLVAAQAHLGQALALYNPHHQPGLVPIGTYCLVYTAATLWLRGFPDQAHTKIEEALAQAQAYMDLHSLLAARSWAATLHLYRGEASAAQTQAEAGLALAHNQAFAYMAAWQTALRGGALTMQSQLEEGITQIRAGLSASHATGSDILQTWFLVLLTDAYRQLGQFEQARHTLEDAFTFMEQKEERFCEAELYRLKGELLLNDACKTMNDERRTSQAGVVSQAAKAEPCFQRALDIARDQKAKSWELRAATSLARLWHQQSKTSQARQLLETSYRWFSEGFETKDLQGAESLLRAMGSQVESPPSPPPQSDPCPVPDESLPLPAHIPGQSSKPIQLLPSRPIPEPPARIQAPPPSSQPADSLFIQEGDYWTVAYEGTVCRIKHSRGMQYVSQLLRAPNQEVHVLRLTTGEVVAATPTGAFALTNRGEQAHDSVLTSVSDAGEILDPQARAAYQQRLNELQDELAEAQAFNDLGRMDKLQDELDFLTQELVHGVGLGGRARRAGSAAERARTSVTKAIKTALKRITDHHPALGAHLRRTIRTGTYCVYTADPAPSHRWQSEPPPAKP